MHKISSALVNILHTLVQLVLDDHGILQFVVANVIVDIDDHFGVMVQHGHANAFELMDKAAQKNGIPAQNHYAIALQTCHCLIQIGVTVEQAIEVRDFFFGQVA